MNNMIAILFSILLPICPLMALTHQKIPLAAPFIMLHDGVYYAYGTNSERGIEVYTSQNLTKWKKHSQLALDRNHTWGERWFRAPHVYFMNGLFYMYYSANEQICVALSDSPLGPFVQRERKPMIDEKSLDPSLFIDADGKPYLFFVRMSGEQGIWMAELTPKMSGIKSGTMRKCLSVSQEWEKVWENTLSGPFVFCRNNTYYMLYCGNSQASHSCGVGYATAANIWGPWVKHTGNPILRKQGKLVGTGHSSLFTDKEGNRWMAFHSHADRETIEPRPMHIARVKFRKTIMSVDRSFITPSINKEPAQSGNHTPTL